MTGLGGYMYLVWGVWLRHCLNERQEDFCLSWPSYFSLPEIVASKMDVNGKERKKLNGSSDKKPHSANGKTTSYGSAPDVGTK
jgi:dihydroceramidase